MAYYPEWEHCSSSNCRYVSLLLAFAHNKHCTPDAALSELEEILGNVCGKTPPPPLNAAELCPEHQVSAAGCRLLSLVQNAAGCCGMSTDTWASASPDPFSETIAFLQRQRDGEQTALTAPAPADPEKNSAPQKVVSQKRKILAAFCGTLAVFLLTAAGFGIYRWGYQASLREHGTYEDGYAAAVSEHGTYQDGYAAALSENGTFEQGQSAGYDAGWQEGFDAGHSQGLDEGYASGYAAASSEAAQNAGAQESDPDDPVWISRHIGSRYHRAPSCILVIDPQKLSLQEAQEQGYTPCSRCYD